MSQRARIDAMYEPEARRWHQAWDAFFEALFKPLTEDELEVIALPIEMPGASVWALDTTTCEAWQSFIDDLFDAMPQDLEGRPIEVDLTRWPSGVPTPPPDMPEMWQAARQDSQHAEERFASAWCILFLAAAGAARQFARH